MFAIVIQSKFTFIKKLEIVLDNIKHLIVLWYLFLYEK